MSSLVIIGDEALVSAWKLLGFETFSVTDEAKLKYTWERVLKGGYKIIYILEKWARALKPEIISLSEKTFPAVVVIPESEGAGAFSEELLKDLSLRAVGTDIVGATK
jgi:vacuolar-type H+-ATPase subunit F/Vma7